METTITFSPEAIAESNFQTTSATIWDKAETSRYGINMLVLGLVVIPGSIATPYAVNLGDWPFALVLFPTVFTLILVMGLAPIRMIVYTAAFALVMNLAIFLAGAIA